MEPDREKIKVLEDWQLNPPKNSQQLRPFLGFAGYYRTYMNFGKIAEQDQILIPCNPTNSKHWFLLSVLPKKLVIVLDSIAGGIWKPTTQKATSKTGSFSRWYWIQAKMVIFSFIIPNTRNIYLKVVWAHLLQNFPGLRQ